MAPRQKKTATVPMFDSLSDIIGTVKGRYGHNALVRGDEVAQVQKSRFATGVFELDAASGGGIPKGRVTLVIGEFSSGKTSLLLKAAANAQRRCRHCQGRFKYRTEVKGEDVLIHVDKPCKCGQSRPNCVVFIDVEGTLDLTYAKELGVRPEVMLLIQPDYAEQGIDVMDAMVRSGETDLVILDSIAQLTPSTEVEESTEKWQQGLGARLTNKMCRKLVSALNSLGPENPLKPAIVLVNQKREKIGVMWGDPTTLPNGKGQEYASALTIDLSQSKVIRMDDNGRRMEKEGTVVGRVLKWRLKKCKVSNGQGKSGEFDYFNVNVPEFDLTVGKVNNEEKVIELALLHNLVRQPKRGTYGFKKITARGESAFITALKEAELWTTLERAVRSKVRMSRATSDGEADDN